jgi:hypothetical protein
MVGYIEQGIVDELSIIIGFLRQAMYSVDSLLLSEEGESATLVRI